MDSKNEICTVEQYLEVIEKVQEGSLYCGYIVIISERIPGTHDAISYILKNSKKGDLTDTINKIFFRYTCGIETKVSSSTIMGKPLYNIEINLNGIPKDMCKKLMTLSKVIQSVVEDVHLNKTNQRRK